MAMNGNPFNNFRYADNTVHITETLRDVQESINAIVEVSEEQNQIHAGGNIGNMYLHA